MRQLAHPSTVVPRSSAGRSTETAHVVINALPAIIKQLQRLNAASNANRIMQQRHQVIHI